jgi:Flp pilus assembly protein TadD
VTLLFACAFLAKPVAVTFPVTLLLLDFWPLERCPMELNRDTMRRSVALIIEKLHLFVLAVIFSGITVWVQRLGGAMDPLENLSFLTRLNNALTAYALYLWHTIYPLELIFPYPHPGDGRPLSHGAIALAALISIAVGCWRARHRAPYFFVGWLWFLVTLLPTIGFIQVGFQSMADRYMYMPLLGLLFAVFAIPETASRRVFVAAAAVVLALIPLTVRQQAFWRTSETLLQRAVAVAPHNVPGRIQLGYVYLLDQRPELAERHLRAAIEVSPESVEAHSNLGSALRMQGRLEEAENAFRVALELDPESYAPLLNLATLRRDRGDLDDTIALLERAVERHPEEPAARRLLVASLVQQNRLDLARERASRFVAAYPEDDEMRAMLDDLESLR